MDNNVPDIWTKYLRYVDKMSHLYEQKCPRYTDKNVPDIWTNVPDMWRKICPRFMENSTDLQPPVKLEKQIDGHHK